MAARAHRLGIATVTHRPIEPVSPLGQTRLEIHLPRRVRAKKTDAAEHP